MPIHANRAPRPALVVSVTLVASVLAFGCGGDSPTTPEDPAGPAIALTQATLSVDGQPVNGLTLSRGHGQGSAARFEATLRQNGMPLAGGTVWVRYQRPMGPGMMGAPGSFMLYDDGTHGDQVRGDGIYCFEDWAGAYGCHGGDAWPGPYHYEFWGTHHGRESNHVTVTVTIAG